MPAAYELSLKKQQIMMRLSTETVRPPDCGVSAGNLVAFTRVQVSTELRRYEMLHRLFTINMAQWRYLAANCIAMILLWVGADFEPPVESSCNDVLTSPADCEMLLTMPECC
jgi:hypothetical protein